MDGRLLPQILERNPRYLGMLGPKNRADRLFAELKIERPENVYAPVGLDIGSDTPSAIALSMIAEIQSVLSGRDGGFLRNRKGPIHAPAQETGGAVLVSETVRPLFCEVSK
jgi:xanthine/CO dehydrogenase XdhC/CoxF family maturation factor